MSMYFVLNPVGRRRCAVNLRRIDFGSGRLESKDQDGKKEQFTIVQVCLFKPGERVAYMPDPRVAIETITGRLVYNPQSYRSQIGGFFGRWLDEHPEWPADREGDWTDVDDLTQLASKPVRVEANLEGDGQYHARATLGGDPEDA